MRNLKKLEETTINKGIFVEIEICVREGKVMSTGSEGRSSVVVGILSHVHTSFQLYLIFKV